MNILCTVYKYSFPFLSSINANILLALFRDWWHEINIWFHSTVFSFFRPISQSHSLELLRPSLQPYHCRRLHHHHLHHITTNTIVFVVVIIFIAKREGNFVHTLNMLQVLLWNCKQKKTPKVIMKISSAIGNAAMRKLVKILFVFHSRRENCFGAALHQKPVSVVLFWNIWLFYVYIIWNIGLFTILEM